MQFSFQSFNEVGSFSGEIGSNKRYFINWIPLATGKIGKPILNYLKFFEKVDLLNITIRNVKKDDDSFLRYANGEVFGFVMLFNQSKDNKAETEMRSLTQKLIDVAISLKGTYYLPYRLHATKEQMYKAYPQAKEFFLLKKKYDPNEIFQNRFYEAYK